MERFGLMRRVACLAAVAAWGCVAVFFGATVVHGGSMRPAIVPGDVVIYRRSAEGVREGDVILFAHPEWPHGVVHRVVSFQSDGSVCTRGDANAVADRDPVPRLRIRGVEALVLPSGKAVAAIADALR